MFDSTILNLLIGGIVLFALCMVDQFFQRIRMRRKVLNFALNPPRFIGEYDLNKEGDLREFRQLVQRHLGDTARHTYRQEPAAKWLVRNGFVHMLMPDSLYINFSQQIFFPASKEGLRLLLKTLNIRLGEEDRDVNCEMPLFSSVDEDGKVTCTHRRGQSPSTCPVCVE
jgi:hypothetical protein